MANKVGKYELVRKLATGGMAEVFLARFEWARGLEKQVVVKRILYHLAEDPSFIEMFFTEAQLASQLSHPNIAQIIEFGESEGVYFLAMEYIDGPSLRALTAAAHSEGSGIPFAHCARIAAFCCEALTHAHELTDGATGKPLNLVHRDVSPDNILISKTGSVKLVDFGIAKAATQNHQTKTGLVKGKLAYMAPEQLRAEPLDRRADIFSLGVVLYELVAGAKPYDAPSEITLIHAMLYEDKVPLRNRRKDVPPELERIINKALERDREQRYADGRAMHADLEEYLISARQPVSALQIAQLVEKHRPAPGKPESTPQPAMATPSRQGAPARTPEPWRAERTPAQSATAAQRAPLARTGTDGDRGGAPAAPREAVTPPAEKTEIIAAPKPLPPSPPPEPPVRLVAATTEAEKSPARPRKAVVRGSVGALLLIGGAAAVLRLLPSTPPSAAQPPAAAAPSPQPPATAAPAPSPPPPAAAAPSPSPQKPEAATPPKAAEVGDQAATKPPSRPASVPAPEQPAKPVASAAPPTVKLVLTSVPPGMLKVFIKGKLKANHAGTLTAFLPPGPVEVEVSGSTNDQSFVKRESLTLDLAQRSREHTITLGQGTVLIRSIPASHVKVDGFPRGDIPLKMKLLEGPHEVQFECDRTLPKCADLPDARKPVTVVPDQSVEPIQRWP